MNRSARWRRRTGKAVLFVISLFLFILAITLMKTGARAVAPRLRDWAVITGPASGMGFGWLATYLMMSGSPVAAATLAFLDAGVIDTYTSFAMITGSRLGASFIVILIGFIYVLRGRDRATSLSMGLLSWTVTATTYLLGFVVGLALLLTDTLTQVPIGSGVLLTSIMERLFDPIVQLMVENLPNWSLFIIGVGIIFVSFNLFDRCLPEMTVKESQLGQMSRLVYRPWVMLLLGAAVTLISMSVSVSLSILVPLSQRGFIRRENAIPYIMGANVTTFIDTLFAAVLLANPQALTVVWIQMISITIVSAFILATVYRRYERAILALVGWLTSNNQRLAWFMALILIIPLLLLLA